MRLKHISVRLFSFSTACDTNTRSPHTMGEEFPGPGKGTCQRTFSVLLHLSGSIFSVETPEPCGPRHAGQFSAETETRCPIAEEHSQSADNRAFHMRSP